MASGEDKGGSDLRVLLASARPTIVPGEFVFVSGDVGDAAVHASVREPEGMSVVITREDADRLGLDFDFVAGWITLTVHSALAAVGLTAAVASALAAEGISCNVIAGLRHDHLLVPANRVIDAIRVLAAL